MLIWQESKSSAFILTVLRTQTCWQAAQWLRNPREVCVFEHQAWKSTVCKTSASQNHHWYEREMCWGLNALCLTPICTLSSTGWHQKMNLNLNYFVLCRAFLQVEYYLFIFIHLFIYFRCSAAQMFNNDTNPLPWIQSKVVLPSTSSPSSCF